MNTIAMRADELRLGDIVVLRSPWLEGEPGEFEMVRIWSLALHGDDVTINDDKITTSMGNTVPILPRSVIARLAG